MCGVGELPCRSPISCAFQSFAGGRRRSNEIPWLRAKSSSRPASNSPPVPRSVAATTTRAVSDDGKDSVHAFTQALRHPGVTTAPAAATRTAAQCRARVPPRRGRWREEVPDEASARRFVPEAMRGGDTGTLIAQQSCGTIDRPERGPSQPFLEPCRKRWFVGRLRRTPETAAALGSPSYKQPPVTATPV